MTNKIRALLTLMAAIVVTSCARPDYEQSILELKKTNPGAATELVSSCSVYNFNEQKGAEGLCFISNGSFVIYAIQRPIGVRKLLPPLTTILLTNIREYSLSRSNSALVRNGLAPWRDYELQFIDQNQGHWLIWIAPAESTGQQVYEVEKRINQFADVLTGWGIPKLNLPWSAIDSEGLYISAPIFLPPSHSAPPPVHVPSVTR